MDANPSRLADDLRRSLAGSLGALSALELLKGSHVESLFDVVDGGGANSSAHWELETRLSGASYGWRMIRGAGLPENSDTDLWDLAEEVGRVYPVMVAGESSQPGGQHEKVAVASFVLRRTRLKERTWELSRIAPGGTATLLIATAGEVSQGDDGDARYTLAEYEVPELNLTFLAPDGPNWKWVWIDSPASIGLNPPIALPYVFFAEWLRERSRLRGPGAG